MNENVWINFQLYLHGICPPSNAKTRDLPAVQGIAMSKASKWQRDMAMQSH